MAVWARTKSYHAESYHTVREECSLEGKSEVLAAAGCRRRRRRRLLCRHENVVVEKSYAIYLLYMW
jgi:hypothetical protein